MKVFVVVSCLLAVASASLIASPHSVLLQPQHLPIIDRNGVPVEPWVNQAARVQHAQLRAAAQIRNGDLIGAPWALASPVNPWALATQGPLTLASHGALLAVPQHLPVLDARGVPVEPLANQIARAQNAAAHLQAQARNGDLAILGRKKRGIISPWAPTAYWTAPQHLPIIDSNGVPVEPLVNQAARVQHAQLRAAAQIRNGDIGLLGVSHGLAAPVQWGLATHGVVLAAPHSPLLDANSVPVEPLANQIARAQNAAAHLAANARTGDLAIHGRKKRSIISPWAISASAPILVVPAPLAIPTLAVPATWSSISHAGRIPLDTPDLVAVRAAHLATKAHGLW